jgi:hypothetical protein
MGKMEAAHPFEKRVGDRLPDVVHTHQLIEMEMEQLLQVDREPQGERHQDLEMYVTYYFCVYGFIQRLDKK